MPTVHKIRRPWEKPAQAKVESAVTKEKRLSETRFYRTKGWGMLRRLQLEKEPLCRHCKDKNNRLVAATMVDHIKPIKDGGERRDENNFQSLCASCHAVKRSAEGRFYQSKKNS